MTDITVFCYCRKQDLKTMIKEAVDDFHVLPRQVMESGREIPITADTDINTINLDEFKQFLPDGEYYDGRWVLTLNSTKFHLQEYRNFDCPFGVDLWEVMFSVWLMHLSLRLSFQFQFQFQKINTAHL